MTTLSKTPPSDNPDKTSFPRFSKRDGKPLPDHLLGEPLVSLSVIRPLFPGNPAGCTLWRWATQGVDGVVLESTRVGKRLFTSHAAAERFISACNAG